MSDAWRMVAARTGGPETIERIDFAITPPDPGQVRVRNAAIGVNFIDTYHRSGLYPMPLPVLLGSEGAGIVEAVGPGVDHVAPGQRVAYMGGGAYATHATVDAGRVVALPDDIGFDVAAASLLKGLTSWMLIEGCAKASPGSTLLIHAAAGGVGAIAVQWSKAIGATVIAHAGNAEKAARARALGADHALSCPFDALAAEVRALTGGWGVDAALDGIGAASWTASLASIARRGLMITYGNASGPVPPFSPLELSKGGSLFLTRPTVFDYTATPEAMAEGCARLFGLIRSGAVDIEIGQRFALAGAADAHRALESRSTTGSTILMP